jgi:hypothetical protein
MAKLTKTDIDINEITNFDKLFTKQEELWIDVYERL